MQDFWLCQQHKKDGKEEDGRENEIIDQYFVLTDIERLDEETPDSNIIEITGPVRRAFVTKGGNVILLLHQSGRDIM